MVNEQSFCFDLNYEWQSHKYLLCITGKITIGTEPCFTYIVFMTSETILAAVRQASESWKHSFNTGNAAGCAAQYEADAVMHARPFGTFTGTEEIQAFWQKLIDDGFAEVEYIEPELKVIDETSALLTSKWKMNNASGIIHKELWVLQEDGSAKLREDDFEALA